MTRRAHSLVLLSLAHSGCLKEDAFVAEYNEAACAWLSDCNRSIDEEECLQQASEAEVSLPPQCDYHPRQARRCLDGMWGLECPVRSVDVTLPAACDLVWDC